MKSAVLWVINISVSIHAIEGEKSEGHTFHFFFFFPIILLFFLKTKVNAKFRHDNLAYLKYSGNLMIFPNGS